MGWSKPRQLARTDELLALVGLDPAGTRPLPVPALRRGAPAGRRGPSPGRGSAADAHGRAVRRGGPDRSRAAPGRVPAPAAGARQDDPLRHPRHRRGDQDGRSDRGHGGGRPPGPVRAAGRDPGPSRLRLRGPVRRRGPRPQAPLAGDDRDLALEPTAGRPGLPTFGPDEAPRRAVDPAGRRHARRRRPGRGRRPRGFVTVDAIASALAGDARSAPQPAGA
jgi:hypothetical protein